MISGVLQRGRNPVRLEPDRAVQDPEDCARTLRVAMPELLKKAAVDMLDVVGLGVGFTASAMLLTLAVGTPLCLVPPARQAPWTAFGAGGYP